VGATRSNLGRGWRTGVRFAAQMGVAAPGSSGEEQVVDGGQEQRRGAGRRWRPTRVLEINGEGEKEQNQSYTMGRGESLIYN
jgi:hypothetical protein